MEITNYIYKYLAAGRAWYKREPQSITIITDHHSANRQANVSDEQVLRNFYQAHAVSNGWPGISYHFVIPKSGKIYQLNHLNDTTWHDAVNYDSIGICLDGYFHPPYNEKPSAAQLKSLRWLMDQLCTKHPEFPAGASGVYGHRERSSTACPGDNMIFYPQNYRAKKGAVTWGQYTDPQPVPTPTPKLTDKQKLTEIDKIVQGLGTIDKWKIRQIMLR